MQYSKEDLEELCNICNNIAIRAGEKILYYYDIFDPNKDLKIKSDDSPVTIADLASHNEIDNKLNSITLGNKRLRLPVLSEESDNISTTARLGWDDYWLVDPLDGTKEFIDKNGEFSINIALISNHRPVLGVIYAPYLKVLYYAMLNNGAYKIENGSSPVRINTNKINKKNKINIASSRRHNKISRYNDFVKSLSSKNFNYNTVISGSAIKFGLVADGTADLYPRFGLTSEWDTAAGDCILCEAGGVLRTFNNEIIYYNKKESLINPEFYASGDKDFDWQELF